MIGIEGYIFFLFKYLYLAKVRFFMNIANRGHHSEQYILRHLQPLLLYNNNNIILLFNFVIYFLSTRLI